MVEWSIFNEIFAVAFNVLYFVIIIGTIFIEMCIRDRAKLRDKLFKKIVNE